MSGDAHVRICESLGVQFPRATRLYLKIDGRLVYLWRAVDGEGEVLDVLVQKRRNKRAALKLMRKLLKKYGFVPDKLVTDDLRSYGAAVSHLGIAKRHERGRWRNNRAENSHQPTRRRERKMRGFKSVGSAQRFLSVHRRGRSMLILFLGIVIFLGGHSLTIFRETRESLIERFGLGPFKGLYSLVAIAGFALIVWGFSRYRAEGLITVWTPPTWTRHLAISLMWFAFVALACMNPARGRIRGWLRHPMLVAIKIWALAHLLVNGDAGGMLLFGSFLAWAVLDRIAVKRRGDTGAERIASFTRADATALGVGTIAYVAMIFLHPILIGMPVIGR